MRYLFLFSLFATFSIVLAKKPKVTVKVLLDIESDGRKLGRIEIGLFGKIVPKTVRNFVELCKRPLYSGYLNTTFNLIRHNEFIQAGMIYGPNGGRVDTIYGQDFEDENYKLKHYGAGWLGSPHRWRALKNTSEFYITLKKLPHLDGTRVVFGKVLAGMDTVWKVELRETKQRIPVKPIFIAKCTVESVDTPFSVKKDGVK